MAETKFTGTIGRRKTATAQVRLMTDGKGDVVINGKPLKQYFPGVLMQQKVLSPFETTGTQGRYDVSVRVVGGGITGQAESVRLGIARALIELNPDYRGSLKKLGFLTRDARKRERKKYGKKSARRSPQWAKR